MVVPAHIPVKEMVENDARCLRLFFRRLISTKFVIQSMGQEASEECLEKMYDEGFLKFSTEPGKDGQMVWRVMLYDQMIQAYRVTNQIKFQFDEVIK